MGMVVDAVFRPAETRVSRRCLPKRRDAWKASGVRFRIVWLLRLDTHCLPPVRDNSHRASCCLQESSQACLQPTPAFARLPALARSRRQILSHTLCATPNAAVFAPTPAWPCVTVPFCAFGARKWQPWLPASSAFTPLLPLCRFLSGFAYGNTVCNSCTSRCSYVCSRRVRIRPRRAICCRSSSWRR